MNRRNHLRNGYTLIELMIAMTISFVGIIGGWALYRSGQNALKVGRTTGEMQQGARKALETMMKELQRTGVDTIDLSVPGAISFASAQDADGFAVNADGTPDWKYAVVYFLDEQSGTLYRYMEPKEEWDTPFNPAYVFDAADPEPVLSHVTDLSFSLNDNLLAITLELSRTIDSADFSKPITTRLSTQVYLRN